MYGPRFIDLAAELYVVPGNMMYSLKPLRGKLVFLRFPRGRVLPVPIKGQFRLRSIITVLLVPF
jgi:hypothetical protein